MEPGRKGREYDKLVMVFPEISSPQWSPAAKAGNTWRQNWSGSK